MTRAEQSKLGMPQDANRELELPLGRTIYDQLPCLVTETVCSLLGVAKTLKSHLGRQFLARMLITRKDLARMRIFICRAAACPFQDVFRLSMPHKSMAQISQAKVSLAGHGNTMQEVL